MNRTRQKRSAQRLAKLDGETRTILLVESGANLNLERASRNIEGVTLVPTTALEPYVLMRHDHLMLSREAAVKLSRALSATKPETARLSRLRGLPAKKAGERGEAAAAKASVKKEAAPRRQAKPAKRPEETKDQGQAQGEKGIAHGDQAL